MQLRSTVLKKQRKVMKKIFDKVSICIGERNKLDDIQDGLENYLVANHEDESAHLEYEMMSLDRWG